MATGVAVLAVLVVAIGSGLLLYGAVRAEAGGRERLPRPEAERRVRRDRPDEGPDR